MLHSTSKSNDNLSLFTPLIMFDGLENISEIYSKDGPLAASISNYVPREQQALLAEKIAITLSDKKILLAEAGTGTGKTLAYLIPAILNSDTVIVSTATKNLQNQLFFRDIPLLKKALNLPLRVSLLKGRSNYLCKYRLELAMTDLLLANTEMVSQFKRIVHWAEVTTDGDISTLDDIPEDSVIWALLTSTPDNCLAQECPAINNCFVYKARAQALEAKVIIINHHLLLSDWGIKAEHEDAKLLPTNINLIIDEAHQVAQIATLYFGTVFSSKKVKLFISDLQLEQKQYATDLQEMTDKIRAINFILEELQKNLIGKPERGFYKALYGQEEFKINLERLSDNLKLLNQVLNANSQRSKGLEACLQRCAQLQLELQHFLPSVEQTNEDLINSPSILWYETYKHSFVLKKSPLEIKQLFAENLKQMAKASILTSATLSIAGNFDLIKNELGLDAAHTMRILSPFDYPNKALLYLPRGMPDPMSDNYISSMIDKIIPVLQYSKGRAFVLFTSTNAMHLAYEKLLENLPADCPYNILVQGTASKSGLVKKFTEEKNSVLFATASFWEGVDVKGPDLHCVIIDKLPFGSPGDPLLQSKINYLKGQGKNPFLELQCHQAALQLVQGAGRLIRSEHDYGVLMICDPRLIAKPYGELFLASLPNMLRTRDIGKIKKFYEQFS